MTDTMRKARSKKRLKCVDEQQHLPKDQLRRRLRITVLTAKMQEIRVLAIMSAKMVANAMLVDWRPDLSFALILKHDA